MTPAVVERLLELAGKADPESQAIAVHPNQFTALCRSWLRMRKALEFYAAPWGDQFGAGGLLTRAQVKKILDDSCFTASEALKETE